MDTSISKLAVYDPRLSFGKPGFAVCKGGASISAMSFAASTANSSSHIYNVISPSLSTILDRNILWSSSFYLAFQAQYATAPAGSGSPLLISGRDFALANFPLHRLSSNISVTINDASVSLNTSQTLQSLLHMADSKAARKAAMSPSRPDMYADVRSGAASSSNPYANVADASVSDGMPNGAHPVVFCDPTGAALVGSGTYTSGGATVTYANGIPVTTATQAVYPIFVRYDCVESLMVSPFTFADHSAHLDTGLFGVTALNVQMQLQNPQAARVLRQLSSDVAISNVSYLTVGTSPFANSSLNLNMITPPIGLQLPPASIVPFASWEAFPFSQSSAIPAGGKSRVQSNVITTSSVPDLLIVRVTPSSYAATDGDWNLNIQSITCQWDNQSGLLSSVPQSRLFQMSQRNGLTDLTWEMFSGMASGPNGPVQTAGSDLVLKFGTDIQLFDSSAPGCGGSYSLSVACDVVNNSASAVTPVITLITVSSGHFVSAAGKSSRSTALLSEADVLGAAPSEMDQADMSRMLGGSWSSSLASFASRAKSLYDKAKPVVSMVKNQLSNVDHPIAAKVVDALTKTGFGAQAGAGRSTGAGRRHGQGRSTGAGRLEDRFE